MNGPLKAKTASSGTWNPWEALVLWIREYVQQKPTFGTLFLPFYILSIALFVRHPRTNFIFDEQEALLANPYVRAPMPWKTVDWAAVHGTIAHIKAFSYAMKADVALAFHRDFWGLLPDRSIGSYRPIPNLVWRVLWWASPHESPFLPHYVNITIHSLSATLLALCVYRVTSRASAAWLAGLAFVASALLTEAVSGVVGLADVLGGIGVILALMALALPTYLMPLGVFLAMSLGLYSKESALAGVPLVPAAALLLDRAIHPTAPGRTPIFHYLIVGATSLLLAALGLSLRSSIFFAAALVAPIALLADLALRGHPTLRTALRFILAIIGAAGAFVAYVEVRRRVFPAPIPTELTDAAISDLHGASKLFANFQRWYAQPPLPKDPLNNPLAIATKPLRVAGALRVYFRGLSQIVIPWPLSGDYSAPQEPIPTRLIFPESVLGAATLIGPFFLASGLAIASLFRRVSVRMKTTFRLVALALIWVPICFFPVSNIPIPLPTVRAERFWYFPAIGTSVLLGLFFAKGFDWTRTLWKRRIWVYAIATFFVVQGLATRLHANDYKDDLAFWDATRRAVPRSAKAHLNYSVMLGARGDLEGRRQSSVVALELAPDWPMASIYLGDTLCRLHRPLEALPHYLHGFELNPADSHLIALALQCLWDENAFGEDSEARKSLLELGQRHDGSWLDFLVDDMVKNGETHSGVDPKYRPRSYNEGPKKDE